MFVGVIGASYRLVDLKHRELLARICEDLFSTERAQQSPYPYVLLSTCNRTELYFSDPALMNAHSWALGSLREGLPNRFEESFYSYFGKDCFWHLARVISGIESAVALETEIQGQVKTAYELASSERKLPHDLHYIFQKGLRVGKKVRTTLSFKKGTPSIEDVILDLAHSRLQSLKDKRILFIGASEMNQKILRFISAKTDAHITLCNRTLARAEKLQKTHNVDVLSWEEMRRWAEYDVVILATKYPGYLISPEDAPRDSSLPALVVDLSVPRNVNPSVDKLPGVCLFNIDQVNRLLERHRRLRQEQISTVDAMIHENVARLVEKFGAKSPQVAHTH